MARKHRNVLIQRVPSTQPVANLSSETQDYASPIGGAGGTSQEDVLSGKASTLPAMKAPDEWQHILAYAAAAASVGIATPVVLSAGLGMLCTGAAGVVGATAGTVGPAAVGTAAIGATATVSSALE